MYVTMFVTAGLWICGIFVPIFQCKPITGAWSFTAQGSCINYIDYLYASSAVNIFTDIVLCSLPIPHLWRLSKFSLDEMWEHADPVSRLDMPLKQRIVLCVLFVGGAG
jgi:hypothetical protein